jgi:hypothetical protein
MPSTSQLTLVPTRPLIVALNCCLCPIVTAVRLGLIDTAFGLASEVVKGVDV